jgi:hypothetical protein
MRRFISPDIPPATVFCFTGIVIEYQILSALSAAVCEKQAHLAFGRRQTMRKCCAFSLFINTLLQRGVERSQDLITASAVSQVQENR